MSESREFIAEAEVIFSFSVCCPRESVILFLCVLVKNSLCRRHYFQVYIVVSSSYHLPTNQWLITKIYRKDRKASNVEII